jgi:hypothetical protein
MDAKRRRAKADADVAHELLIAPLKVLLLDHNANLNQAVWPMESESWKTRPRLNLLVKFAKFYKALFEASPSGLILHSTMMNAICALDQDCEPHSDESYHVFGLTSILEHPHSLSKCQILFVVGVIQIAVIQECGCILVTPGVTLMDHVASISNLIRFASAIDARLLVIVSQLGVRLTRVPLDRLIVCHVVFASVGGSRSGIATASGNRLKDGCIEMETFEK